MFALSLDVGPQWRLLGKLLDFSESQLNSPDIGEESNDQLKCFAMLKKWPQRSTSATYGTLGKALLDKDLKRDDLFVKHCKGIWVKHKTP